MILILFSSIEMNGQAALGLGSIVNRLLFVFPCSSFKALPADSLKLFMNSMTDLTCLFLQAVAKEEEVCTQLVLSLFFTVTQPLKSKPLEIFFCNKKILSTTPQHYINFTIWNVTTLHVWKTTLDRFLLIKQYEELK